MAAPHIAPGSATEAPEAGAPDWIASVENPYLHGLFAPVGEEVTAEDLPVEGEIPRDLAGVFLRNGPNAVQPPRGRYHWFDGDGMLHAVAFADGRASYRNRWIRTAGLDAERRAGRALWPGYMEPPDPDAPAGSGSDGWLKDTANTDVVFHAGSALALWYQCGLPYRVDARTLETKGAEDFGGRLARQVSAHAKVDPASGELLFFDYATRPPYLSYHVADAGGRLVHSTPVEVPGPRLPHDMAFTANHAILIDLPLFWDPALLEKKVHKLRFHRDLPSRFAVLPRRGDATSVRWFEAEPCYIYHVVNSWEEDGAIVMDACRVLDAPSRRPGPPPTGPLARMLATLKLEAQLWRWRFDLRTGQTTETQLDDRIAEFPSINAERSGAPSRYGYLTRIATAEPTLLFDGIVKFDTQTGRAETHELGPGRFCSESPFAPRAGARDEDDGYVVAFVHDARDGRSEAIVIDAKHFSGAPLARIPLPQRVPVGFHACWVDAGQLPAV